MSNHLICISLLTFCRLAMDRDMYSCRYCRESFSVVSELKQHIKEEQRKQEHSTDSATYTCAFCSEARETVTEIKEHVQRCHHTNPFQCNGCSTVCPTLAALRRHVRSHIPFQCNHCERIFREQWHLKQHLQIHIQKPASFKCDRFDQKFC